MPNPNGNVATLIPGSAKGTTNKGGRGRIPSRVRELCAKGFEEATPELIKIAKGRKDKLKQSDGTFIEVRADSASEQVAAYQALGKYGIGEMAAVSMESSEWLAEIAEETADFFATWEIPKERYDQWFQQCVQDRLKAR